MGKSKSDGPNGNSNPDELFSKEPRDGVNFVLSHRQPNGLILLEDGPWLGSLTQAARSLLQRYANDVIDQLTAIKTLRDEKG